MPDAELRCPVYYMDKLDGRITQEFFDKQAALCRVEQDALPRRFQDIQKAAPASIDQAIDMLQPDQPGGGAIFGATAA